MEEPNLQSFIIMPIIFGALGLSLAIIPLIVRNNKKKRCTILVNATVLRIEHTTNSEGTELSRPVYKYHFMGQDTEASPNYYTNALKIKEGDPVQLYVNPNKATDFYCANGDGTTKLLVVIGIIFSIAAAISGFIVYMINDKIANHP